MSSGLNAGSVALVNSSTYLKHTSTSSNWGQSLQETPPPSPRFDYYYPSATTTDESFSDEFRLSGNAAAGSWRWTLGAFYKRMDDDTLPFNYYFGVPGPSGSPLPAPETVFVDVLSKATSLFGDSNYRLFGNLVLGAGARYFRDNESTLIVGDTSREGRTFTSTDPRIYVRYEISRDVNVYANAAKGFRSGGFNGLGLPEYQPEHAWTYDLGTKMRLLNGHMTLDSDVFLSDHGGYQIIGFLPPPAVPLGITRNAGDVRIKGIESSVTWSPTGRWLLSVNGDYIDARFVHINVLGSSYDVGDPLDLVPRYQVTTSMEREFLWHGRSGFARLDYT